MKRMLLGMLAIVMMTFSCRKNEDFTKVTVDLPDAQEVINAYLKGTVVSDAQIGLIEAKVEIVQAQKVIGEVLTDKEGQFEFSTILDPTQKVYMMTTKEGYVSTMALMANVQANSSNEVEMVMMPAEMVRRDRTPPAPSDVLIELTGTVTDAAGNPIVLKYIMVEAADNLITYGFTDRNGNFTVPTRADQELKFSIVDRLCRVEDFSTQIGPFAEGQDIGTFVSTPSQTTEFILSGQLIDCDGVPIVEGFVDISGFNINARLVTDENGFFQQKIEKCATADNIRLTLIGFDGSFGATSDFVVVIPTGDGITLDPIIVCSEGTTSIGLTTPDTTFSSTTLHAFVAGRDGNTTNIYPLYGSNGLTLNFVGAAPGTFEVSNFSFTDGRLALIAGTRVGQETSMTVEITAFEENLIEGTFTGIALGNDRNLIAVTGEFSIEK